MQVEIGKVYEGTVKNITKYGAFVNIDNPDEERLMGMVHISEISRKYVNEIRDFVTEGQRVRVKCIGITPEGKISLSMKQTEGNDAFEEAAGHSEHIEKQDRQSHNMRLPRNGNSSEPSGNHGQNSRGRRNGKPYIYEPKRRQDPSGMTFEDMLSHFKQNSEERMCDIKRNNERKNRSRRK